MGIAVVRRGPNILEELAKSLIPSLIGSAIEDGKRRSYATAEQGLYQNLYDQISQAPQPAPVDLTPQNPATPWEKAYGVPQGGGEASWLNTWDAAHQGTNDPMALLGQALQSDFAKKYGAEGAMKAHQQLMGVVDGQKQARIAAANRSGMDSMATRMGSQGYDYRSPHQVMPDWMRYGMYGGNQGEFTDILQHLSPNMQFKETDLGNQKIGSAFDPGTGALNPLFQAAVGISPNTQYAQDAQTARQREDWALRQAERRADPKYQLMSQAYQRYNEGERTPEVMQALNLSQASQEEEVSSGVLSSLARDILGAYDAFGGYKKGVANAAFDGGLDLASATKMLQVLRYKKPAEQEAAIAILTGTPILGDGSKNPYYRDPAVQVESGGFVVQPPNTSPGSGTPQGPDLPTLDASKIPEPAKGESTDKYVGRLVASGVSPDQIVALAQSTGDPAILEIVMKTLAAKSRTPYSSIPGSSK